ncbi:hypothetical protein, partial [Pseudonocardia sp. NPDC049154]|uniref:hypothetical protein n=1 Tax=Pseudonocardia sp. NPDC049154 TaxID=3155501 RepID=UPI0033C17E48
MLAAVLAAVPELPRTSPTASAMPCMPQASSSVVSRRGEEPAGGDRHRVELRDGPAGQPRQRRELVVPQGPLPSETGDHARACSLPGGPSADDPRVRSPAPPMISN